MLSCKETNLAISADSNAFYQENTRSESSISAISSGGNSPILKKTCNNTKKEDLMPAWFKEINEKYENFCEKLTQVKHGQNLLKIGLKEFDEKQKLLGKTQKTRKKTTIFCLNYHLIALIISFCGNAKSGGGYLQFLLRFSQINRYFYKLLQDDCIWKMVVRDYFGAAIIALNEHNFKEFSRKVEKTESFWKIFVRNLFESFEKMKKTMIYFKDCGCPQKIDLKSQQKDLQDALKFLQQNLMLFLNKNQRIFHNLYEEFAKKENLLRILESLLSCNNYFIHSDTVDFLIYEIHREKSVEKLLISRKFLQNHWSLCRNHEQDLLIFLNTKLIPSYFSEKSFVLAETHYKFSMFSLNCRENHYNLLRKALNKRFETAKTVIYNRILDKFQVYAAEIFLEKEGNISICLENLKIAGSFDLKSANFYAKHEFLRNLAVGRLVFSNNRQLIAYLSLFYKKTSKEFEKKLFLYASDANNETILAVLLENG